MEVTQEHLNKVAGKLRTLLLDLSTDSEVEVGERFAAQRFLRRIEPLASELGKSNTQHEARGE